MSDKNELLDQLKIDRSAPQATGWSPVAAIALSIFTALIGGFVALKFFTPDPVELDNQTVAAAPKPKSSDTTTPVKSNAAASNSSEQSGTEDNRILNASGYITARRIATVSSEISGLITEVRVEEGMLVEQGQVLAKLDNAVAQVNLKLARSQLAVQQAQIKSVQANLDEARRVLNRAHELRQKKLTPEASVTSAAASVESLEAQIDSATANVSVSQNEILRQKERLEDHIVRAPFAGVVTVKNAQMGEIVSPGSAGGGFTRTGICTIVDMDSLEIEVDVNEAFIGRVFAGQKVEANLDAYPSWKIPASVIAIIPTADRAKATVRVRIRIEDKDPRVLPDMGVKVAFLKT